MKSLSEKINLPLISKTGIATVDQAILSLLNFLISILLIKTVTKVEYGYYSIAFPVSLFLISIQNAIINTPLAVLLVSKKDPDKKRYVASLFYGQLIGLLPAICISLLIIFLLQLGPLETAKGSVASALSLASIGLLLREFLRAYFFAEQSPVKVLQLDILHVLFFIILAGFSYFFQQISVAVIFLLSGFSSLTASCFFKRNQEWIFRRMDLSKSYRENWRYGKWALVGVFVTHAQTYSYLYMLGAILGSEAAADVSAARLLLMPMVLFQVGWSKIIIPHGARMREQGQLPRFFRQQIWASSLFSLGITIYVLIIITFSGFLQQILFTEKYAESLQYIVYWGAVFIVKFIALNGMNGLLVNKEFQIVTKLNFITMLVTVVLAYYLIRHYAITGGLTALIVGETLLAIGLWYCFAKSVMTRSKEHMTTSN